MFTLLLPGSNTITKAAYGRIDLGLRFRGIRVHTMKEGVTLQEKGPPASNSKQEAERAISGGILSLTGPDLLNLARQCHQWRTTCSDITITGKEGCPGASLGVQMIWQGRHCWSHVIYSQRQRHGAGVPRPPAQGMLQLPQPRQPPTDRHRGKVSSHRCVWRLDSYLTPYPVKSMTLNITGSY